MKHNELIRKRRVGLSASSAALLLAGLSFPAISPANAAACNATPVDLGSGVYEVKFTNSCDWTAPAGLSVLEALLVGAGGTSIEGYAGGGGEVKVVGLDKSKSTWTIQVGLASASDGDSGRNTIVSATGPVSHSAAGGRDGAYPAGGTSGSGFDGSDCGAGFCYGGPGGGAGAAAVSGFDGGAGLLVSAAATAASLGSGLFGSDTRCFGGGGATAGIDESSSPAVFHSGTPGCGGGTGAWSGDPGSYTSSATDATANSGGGGGGVDSDGEAQGAAADGVVIFRYTVAAGGSCSSITTLSQGGWSNNSSSSPLTNSWFGTKFASGLKVGGATNSVTLTTAGNLRQFLPQSGTPAVLSGNRSNLTSKQLKNVLAGQAAALTLNLALNTGLADASLASESGYSGTVSALLADVNAALNGTGSPSKATLANLNRLAEYVNLSFPGGLDQSRVICGIDD